MSLKPPSQHPFLIIPPHISTFWSYSDGPCQSKGPVCTCCVLQGFLSPCRECTFRENCSVFSRVSWWITNKTDSSHRGLHWVAFLSLFSLFFFSIKKTNARFLWRQFRHCYYCVCDWFPHVSFVIKIRLLGTASFFEKLERKDGGEVIFSKIKTKSSNMFPLIPDGLCSSVSFIRVDQERWDWRKE